MVARTGSTMEKRSDEHFDSFDMLHFNSVFADCLDQLEILGHIQPGSYELRKDANKIATQNISSVLDDQKQLEEEYGNLISNREALNGVIGSSDAKVTLNANIDAAKKDLRHNVNTIGRTFRQNPLTADNVTKVNFERQFAQQVIALTVNELNQKGAYSILSDTVAKEKAQKAELQKIISREEANRKKIRRLEQRIVDVKKEKGELLEQRNEMIAHLKDQLQEVKAKKSMEQKYVRKMTDMEVAQTSKRCTMDEAALVKEKEVVEKKIDSETRVNTEIQNFLNNHIRLMAAKEELWQGKHEKEVEEKQLELDRLKAEKARDLARLQATKSTFEEHRAVVVRYRVAKERRRKEEELEALQLRSTIRIQAWWRGVMVRRGLGAYGKKKKKKGKKGKGGKKGKKK